MFFSHSFCHVRDRLLPVRPSDSPSDLHYINTPCWTSISLRPIFQVKPVTGPKNLIHNPSNYHSSRISACCFFSSQNMSSYGSHASATKPSLIHPLQPIDANSRRQSTTSNVSPTSSLSSPRVQLVPHARTLSYDGSLSPSDMELLAKTSFDAKDMSSQDFDFDDVFTYDKPQKKLKSIVEVSSTRDWSQSHYQHHPSSSTATKMKYNRGRTTGGELYKKNRSEARR